jgi:hypothetical protein
MRPGFEPALEALLPSLDGPEGTHGRFEFERARDGATIAHGWVYAPHVERLFELLGKSSVISSFDWVAWLQSARANELLHETRSVADADLEDVRRLLTALVRRERFDGGSIILAIERGIVSAAVRRLVSLVREAAATR